MEGIGGYAEKIANTGTLGVLLVVTVFFAIAVTRLLLKKLLEAHENHAATLRTMNEETLKALQANTAAATASVRAQEASNEVIAAMAEASRTNTAVVEALAKARGADPAFGSGSSRRHER